MKKSRCHNSPSGHSVSLKINSGPVVIKNFGNCIINYQLSPVLFFLPSLALCKSCPLLLVCCFTVGLKFKSRISPTQRPLLKPLSSNSNPLYSNTTIIPKVGLHFSNSSFRFIVKIN
ncbi:uncharacterized protein LOC113370932 [Ctenocephalides felis]|uniref:uncharacterized protein LOC113370932 n=1 Tax=Ctenocephalides felis TaxID=7515 RepID=UPI000E6E4089|nr:uncharacterized protein LOC113370932 [Ctenocephalides felis]